MAAVCRRCHHRHCLHPWLMHSPTLTLSSFYLHFVFHLTSWRLLQSSSLVFFTRCLHWGFVADVVVLFNRHSMLFPGANKKSSSSSWWNHPPQLHLLPPPSCASPDSAAHSLIPLPALGECRQHLRGEEWRRNCGSSVKKESESLNLNIYEYFMMISVIVLTRSDDIACTCCCDDVC